MDFNYESLVTMHGMQMPIISLKTVHSTGRLPVFVYKEISDFRAHYAVEFPYMYMSCPEIWEM